MLLRSFVAPGYMLDINPASDDLFSITLCGGLGGINAIAGLEDKHDQHHDHHKHHDHHQYHNDDDQHEHKSEQHSFSACGSWSSSSQLLLTELSAYDISTYVASAEISRYQEYLLSRLANDHRFARAPPRSQII